VAQDSELLFDYGDRYWGAPDKARPVEAAETGDASADEAPPQRRRVSPGGGQRDDAGWEAQLAKLKTYRAMHGHCNVPQGWAEDPTLGKWVINQRQHKKKLDRGEPSQGMTAERAAKLEALGFVWELSAEARSTQLSKGRRDDTGWGVWLAKLKKYKRKHGDCNVPQGWAKDPRLGNWVSDQRKRKKKLDRGEPSSGMTAERAARLEALGFVWAPGPKVGGAAVPNEAAWEAQLARLAAYKAEHGDCSVPQRWAEDPTLGQWVRNQRAHKRKLDHGEPSEGMTAARVARLEALGFAWELSSAAISIRNSKASLDDARWEAQLAQLKVYKRRQGDCSVPARWAEDPRLGTWVKHQRRLKRKLDRGEPSEGMTAARAAKLEALGFVWELSAAAISIRNSKSALDDAGWEAQLAKLKTYMAIHGHCNVPHGWAEDPTLGRWVSRQRRLKRKLDRGEPCRGMTAERAAKLAALGFAWQTLAARRRPAPGVGSGAGAKRKRSAAVTEEPAGWRRRLGRGRHR
jgi:hypothetical protein